MVFEQFLICNAVNELTTKRNGYFTFHTIIDKARVHGAISFMVCVGSPVIIKKVNKQVH